MKAEGSRQKAVGERRKEGGGRGDARAAFQFPRSAYPALQLPRSAFCLLLSAFCFLLPACAIDERRSGLPPTAQVAIDRLTEHLAERRFAEIHAEAADEWRAAATADASRAVLERGRETLGRVVSRAPVRAAEQQNSSGELRGHTLSLTYNTKFERADAIEQLTLVERDGRWQLARYTVNSDALK